MRMDVGPPRRALGELLSKLADEDVDRAVAVRHRVAPDALIHRFALQHPPGRLGEQLEELELAAGQVDADAADERLELVAADLYLAGDYRAGLDPGSPGPATAGDRFDPRDRLLRVAGLGDPVVDAEPQAADTL